LVFFFFFFWGGVGIPIYPLKKEKERKNPN